MPKSIFLFEFIEEQGRDFLKVELPKNTCYCFLSSTQRSIVFRTKEPAKNEFGYTFSPYRNAPIPTALKEQLMFIGRRINLDYYTGIATVGIIFKKKICN